MWLLCGRQQWIQRRLKTLRLYINRVAPLLNESKIRADEQQLLAKTIKAAVSFLLAQLGLCESLFLNHHRISKFQKTPQM